MNCYNHPTEIAVAQCSECNKGLCRDCASVYKTPICKSCNKKLKRKTIRQILWSLLILGGVFYIGYLSNFAGFGKTDNRWWSGYFLTAIAGGWSFLNLYFPYRLQQGSFALWGVYILLKTAVSFVLGVFVTPYILIRNLVDLIKLFR